MTAAGRLGSYRLLHELGRGGQGVVWLAEDVALGRRVAVKLLRPGACDSAEALHRFLREAELASRLDHPGICAVYGSGIEGRMPWFAMRHVEGESLAQRLAAGGAPPADRRAVLEVVRLVEETARALHAAHEAGVLHRDVKPGNILLDQDRRPVIADFGLAREESGAGAGTLAGDRLGTPAYRSPEQITSGLAAVDRRSDVYALGVTLYEALTLRRPFDAPSAPELERAIVRGDAPRPRQWNRAVPRDLDVVVTTAIDRDPARRYRTAQDFAEDLRRVREREPIRARPAGPWLRARRWAERSPVSAAALASVVLALATGLTTTLMLLGQARAERDAKERALGQVRDAERRAEAGFSGATRAIDQMLTQVAVDISLAAPGTQMEGRELVEDARDLSLEFLSTHGNDPRLREQIGRAYLNLGRFTGLLEGSAAALLHLEEGLWMLAPFAWEKPQALDVLGDLHDSQALHLSALGRGAEAASHRAVAAALREELLVRAPRDPAVVLAAAQGDLMGGEHHRNLSQQREAERCFRSAIARCDRMAGPRDPDSTEPMIRIQALIGLANLLDETRCSEAIGHCCRAIAELESLPPDLPARRTRLAHAWETYGVLLERDGNHHGAGASWRNALRILGEPDPGASRGTFLWVALVRARYWSHLGLLLHRMGDRAGSDAAWRAALEHDAEFVDYARTNPAAARDYTDVCFRRAMVRAEQGRWDGRNEADVRAALSVREQYLDRHPEHRQSWIRCAEAHELLGRFERRPVVADDHLRKALELLDRVVALGDDSWWCRVTRAEFRLRLGIHRTAQGREADAEHSLRLADEECEILGRERPADHRRARIHAAVLEKLVFAMNEVREQESALVRLVDLTRRFLSSDDPDFDRTRYWSAMSRLAGLRWISRPGVEARGPLGETIRYFGEQVRAEPRNPLVRAELAFALTLLSAGHEQRGDLEEARETVGESLKHYYEAGRLDPTKLEWRSSLRRTHVLMVSLLQRGGAVRDALAETDRLLALDPASQEDAWTAAVALARCAADRSAPAEDAEAYAAKAFAALREAHRRGFRDLGRIQAEHALDALRDREDFQRLVRALRLESR